MTGDRGLDPVLKRSTDWLLEMYTDGIIPFIGVSTRQDLSQNGQRCTKLLPGLELLADDCPTYSDLAENILSVVEEKIPARASNQGGIGWLAAAALHDPEIAEKHRGRVRAPWVHRHAIDATHYYTIGQPGYQAMVALRGLPPRKGLQMWAVKESPPFLCPEPGHDLTAKAWGFDLASRDSTTNELQRSDISDLTTITSQHGDMWVSYLVTPESLIVLHTMPQEGDRETIWCGSHRHIDGYHLEGDRVVAEGAAGSLHWWGLRPTLGDDGLSIHFRDDSRSQLYSFASADFRPVSFEAETGKPVSLQWEEPSGCYMAHVNHTGDNFADKNLAGLEVILERGEARVWKVP